jgi:hypothetical protein
MRVLILPVNNSIDDIKYEWQFDDHDDEWRLKVYVLTDSTKQSVFGIGSFFEDGVELEISENVLSSSKKAFIAFTRPHGTEECVGKCYVSLK